MNGKAMAAGLITVTAAGLGLGLGCLLSEDASLSEHTSGRVVAATAAPAATARPPVVRFDEGEVVDAESTVAQVDTTSIPEPEARDEAEASTTDEETPLSAEDVLYERLSQIQASGDAPEGAELDALLKKAFEAHEDWELQELAFALLRKTDPEAHRTRVLALAAESSSPVGQLVGAINSAEDLDSETQDALLFALASAQSAALDEVSEEDAQELEAIQRRDFAEGAVAALIERLPPSRQVEWLLGAGGTERRILAEALDGQDVLSGDNGLLSLHDARQLCESLLSEGQAREDLSGWGPELELAARFPSEARDGAGWAVLLERARASGDGLVSGTAGELLGGQE